MGSPIIRAAHLAHWSDPGGGLLLGGAQQVVENTLAAEVMPAVRREPGVLWRASGGQGFLDPRDLGAACCASDSDHAFAVSVRNLRLAQWAPILVEETSGRFEELQSPSEHLMLLRDVGEFREEGQDHHEPSKICDVAPGSVSKPRLKVFTALAGQFQGVALCGFPLLHVAFHQPGFDEPGDGGVEAAVADVPGEAVQLVHLPA